MRVRRTVPVAALDHAPTGAADEPEAVALERDRTRAVGHWLGALPDQYRQVIDLYYFDELSYHEMSARMGKPISTVRMRLHRARRILERAGNPMSSMLPL